MNPRVYARRRIARVPDVYTIALDIERRRRPRLIWGDGVCGTCANCIARTVPTPNDFLHGVVRAVRARASRRLLRQNARDLLSRPRWPRRVAALVSCFLSLFLWLSRQRPISDTTLTVDTFRPGSGHLPRKLSESHTLVTDTRCFFLSTISFFFFRRCPSKPTYRSSLYFAPHYLLLHGDNMVTRFRLPTVINLKPGAPSRRPVYKLVKGLRG